MSPNITCINGATFLKKIAAFDFDWTLVKPKENRKFPKSVDDWEWLFPTIPDKIHKLYNDGYMIVIFTNQSKPWKKDQIIEAMTTLKIPLHIVIAFEKMEYKPNRFMFDLLVNNREFNKDESFFVGDALGRKDDFADSDKLFAENIGIKWIEPEKIFNEEPSEYIIQDISNISNDKEEVIIMMGYPGSGKSTIAQNICAKYPKYICIQGDIYKTSKGMIKKASEYISEKRSIIFDATNSSKSKRNEYISFAQKYGYKIKCLHVTTPLENSYQRNKQRPSETQVPRIAYSVYTKYYEEPKEDEGFTLIQVETNKFK